MKRVFTFFAIACICCSATQTEASIYKLSWSGTMTSTAGALAGVANVGDTISLDVFVDNGGSSTLSQTWAASDTVNASLTVGGYSATYIADFFPSAGFQTDAGGNLILADWFGTNDSLVNSDNFGVGGGVRLFNSAIRAFDGQLSFYVPLFGDINDWTGPTPTVPEPGTLMIWSVFAGAGLIVSKRRRNVA